MPIANESVTALVRKAVQYTTYLIISVALLASGIVLWRQKSLELAYLDSKPILVELAQDESSRKQGLSGRKQLAPGHGMLFVFNEPNPACMWMKDMSFGLDVYWYTATGQLISYYKDIKPGSFPNLYCPELSASYMLEVNIGEFVKPPKRLVL